MEMFLEGSAFFDGMTWQTVVGLLSYFLFGLFGINRVFAKIKARYNLSGQSALYMVQALNIVITVVALWLTGELAGVPGMELSGLNVLAFVASLYKSSALAYEYQKGDKELPDPFELVKYDGKSELGPLP